MRHDDLAGWFDFQHVYQAQVRRCQDGAHFVEVGTYLGRSAAYMGEQIKASGKSIRLDAVDTFRGAPDPSHDNADIRSGIDKHGGSLLEQFRQNMRDCGVDDIVQAVPTESVEAARLYPDESLDFVFIDGDHTYLAVCHDIQAWWPKVKPGGYLGGHDLGEDGPGRASEEFGSAKQLPRREILSSWLFRKPMPNEERGKVLLGMPGYANGLNFQTAKRAFVECTGKRHDVSVLTGESSLLANGFNSLWVAALTGGYTHFAMCHSDIIPQTLWLDVLMEEMNESKVDIIGAVAPIKDARGITSIGIANPGESAWWSPKRRFTMQEIMKLPYTFTAEDAGYPEDALLLNTGCWLADLRNPLWMEKDDEGSLYVHFNIRDRIWEHEGKLVVGVQSEDWFFSQRLFEIGLDASATRACKLNHVGGFSYPNNVAWGLWKNDQATKEYWDTAAEEACSLKL